MSRHWDGDDVVVTELKDNKSIEVFRGTWCEAKAFSGNPQGIVCRECTNDWFNRRGGHTQAEKEAKQKASELGKAFYSKD